MTNKSAAACSPRIVFFSGGSALREVAGVLAQHTAHAYHIITSFDSGGSSAELRRVFGIPAIGDLRHRMIALADLSVPGGQELVALWSKRLEETASDHMLRTLLVNLASGQHELMAGIAPDAAVKCSEYLSVFLEHMPKKFQLQGACLGNLILTGCYFVCSRNLEKAVQSCSRLLQVQGKVFPISTVSAHLAVRMASGRVIVGQHLFTGKHISAEDLQAIHDAGPITDLWLTASLEDSTRINLELAPELASEITRANLICYPVGSFFSSILANLLLCGVNTAIASTNCPKLFLPNPGYDSESHGYSLQGQIEYLLKILRAGNPAVSINDVLTHIAVDRENVSYPGGIPERWLEEQGIQLISYHLVAEDKPGNISRLHPEQTCQLFLSLAGLA